jgi:hypothetical protein
LIFRPSFINDPLPGNRSIKARVRADAIDYSSAQDQTSGFFTAQPLPMRFPTTLFLSEKRRKTCGF